MHSFIGCRCLLHTRHVTWLQTLSLIRLQTEGQIDLKQKHTAGQKGSRKTCKNPYAHDKHGVNACEVYMMYSMCFVVFLCM